MNRRSAMMTVVGAIAAMFLPKTSKAVSSSADCWLPLKCKTLQNGRQIYYFEIPAGGNWRTAADQLQSSLGATKRHVTIIIMHKADVTQIGWYYTDHPKS